MAGTNSNAFPMYSSRIYLRLKSGDIAMLKFLLEANDNLAYLSTVSPRTAVVRLVFAPGQEKEVRAFLESVSSVIAWTEVWSEREATRSSRQFCSVAFQKLPANEYP